jgi:hypothetical protein
LEKIEILRHSKDIEAFILQLVKWILQALIAKINVIPRKSSQIIQSTLPSIHASQPQLLRNHPIPHQRRKTNNIFFISICEKN